MYIKPLFCYTKFKFFYIISICFRNLMLVLYRSLAFVEAILECFLCNTTEEPSVSTLPFQQSALLFQLSALAFRLRPLAFRQSALLFWMSALAFLTSALIFCMSALIFCMRTLAFRMNFPLFCKRTNFHFSF